MEVQVFAGDLETAIRKLKLLTFRDGTLREVRERSQGLTHKRSDRRKRKADVGFYRWQRT